jgi:hypothetical protein
MDALLDPIKLNLDLDAAIRTLPTTADGVAELLERLGVRGTRSTMSCPLALYLRGRLVHTVPFARIYVSSLSGVEACGGIHTVISAKASRPWLQEFVWTFDTGGYPKLWGRS